MVSLEKNKTCSLVRLPAGKKASQRLWMFRIKEEQDGRKKEPSYVGALNDKSTLHKSEGFQLAGQKENLECRLKEIMYGLIQVPRLRYLKFDSFMQKDKIKDRCSKKQVLGYVLTVGITTVEFWTTKEYHYVNYRSLVYDSCISKQRVDIVKEVRLSSGKKYSLNEELCSDVHQVGDEIEVEVMRSFNWPPSELITKDGFLPERGSQFMEPNPLEVIVDTNSRGNILVTDINHKIIFKVKPCNTYFHQQRLLLHADDRPIAMLRDKLMTEHKRWKVYKGDSTAKSDMIFSTKTAKVMQSKTNVHVFLENKKRKKDDACDFMIKVALIAIVDAIKNSTNRIVEVVRDGVIETALGGFGV
ncbi:LURP-one-related 15-like protein [Tanacetum coccineum]